MFAIIYFGMKNKLWKVKIFIQHYFLTKINKIDFLKFIYHQHHFSQFILLKLHKLSFCRIPQLKIQSEFFFISVNS